MSMAYTTLIDVATLAAHLENPRWVILDCRFDLAEPMAGQRAYAAGHIPGARYAHLDHDLSGPVTSATGRHPLPDPVRLAAQLGQWGVAADTQVVAYDDAGGAFAARAWWLLRWLGHARVAVLDGGWAAWQAQGGATTPAVPAVNAAEFVFRPALESVVSAEEVLQAVRDKTMCLLDARAPERFRGEVEPIDPVAGHVPGALNHPFQRNLEPDGRFLPAQMLRQRFQVTLGTAAAAQVVHMCGSGVTACHNLLAMAQAGLSGSRLYAGSWSEWIRDPARPVASGE